MNKHNVGDKFKIKGLTYSPIYTITSVEWIDDKEMGIKYWEYKMVDSKYNREYINNESIIAKDFEGC